ncbi:bifunctional alpha,alpha-trehalose-phosphate synthase (UDP-forming)/trehalose-phosphatase [bacterium]|nr:MAG: bifunctional alpha,alpha-trehalose-phosphate synthase (UDP-forming)/trehalose-phosphatase [bacterium]
MKRIIIVSNRLPVTVTKRKNGLSFNPSVGGLSTGLSSFYKSYNNVTWIGWPGIFSERLNENERKIMETRLNREFSCHPVLLTQKDVDLYYNGFCNKTIWPLFHYFLQYTTFDKKLWYAYQQVNGIFCEKLSEIVNADDIIWIHDYHLMLLPKLIREKLPDAMIGFFLHIPFPSFEIFRVLPWRREILEGLSGADLIGFHTYSYVKHFLESVRRILGYEHAYGEITIDNRVIKVDSFPMGIDYEKFANAASDPKVKKEIDKVCKTLGDYRIVLSIDRLDYTKGIPQRLEAFDLFLEKYPEFKEKVIFIMVAVPSRTKVEHYRLLKKEVDELIGKINGKYGTLGWTPIRYIYRFLPFHRLAALYNIADIALVTPQRDGMNLIAKEFIASKSDSKGVLILSEMAGAAEEMGEAIIVNPNNRETIADALREALLMTEEEQIERNKAMQRRLKRYNVKRWAMDFVETLIHIKKLQQDLRTKRLTDEIKTQLLNDYSKSNTRLIFLDYDGTLVHFMEKPEKAKPSKELMELLSSLAHQVKNEVVIISGRERETLDRWFGDLNIGLVAEHGAWIKERGGEWEIIEPLEDTWKKEILPILELYVDRTPGSFIEEKEFSLVWHYRNCDAELADVRVKELKDVLLNLTANLNIGIMEGNKVIEIKNTNINKGRAVLKWISKKEWDFILAIGDDMTDEDVFGVLPDTAYSIKVGLGLTRARFYIESVEKVRGLLKSMCQKGGEDEAIS